MEGKHLEQFTVEGLRGVARQHGADPNGNRAALLDRLIDHFGAIDWPNSFLQNTSESQFPNDRGKSSSVTAQEESNVTMQIQKV